MYMLCGTWREIFNNHHENRVKDVFKIPSYSKLNKRCFLPLFSTILLEKMNLKEGCKVYETSQTFNPKSTVYFCSFLLLGESFRAWLGRISCVKVAEEGILLDALWEEVGISLQSRVFEMVSLKMDTKFIKDLRRMTPQWLGSLQIYQWERKGSRERKFNVIGKSLIASIGCMLQRGRHWPLRMQKLTRSGLEWMMSGVHRLFFIALLNSLGYTFQNTMQLLHNRAKKCSQTHFTAMA